MEMAVNLHQIDIGQEGGRGKSRHDTSLPMDDRIPDECTVVVKELSEETEEGRVVLQDVGQHRQKDGDGDGIEVIVDVYFVGPHPLSPEILVDPVDGVAGTNSAPKRIAVGRKDSIISVQQVGNEFEDAHPLRLETVNDALFSGSHLVDDYALGDTQAFAVRDPFRLRDI